MYQDYLRGKESEIAAILARYVERIVKQEPERYQLYDRTYNEGSIFNAAQAYRIFRRRNAWQTEKSAKNILTLAKSLLKNSFRRAQ